MDPAPKVRTLNAWIKQYAASHGYTYLDYYTALADAAGGMKAGLAERRRAPDAGRLRDHGAAGGAGDRRRARDPAPAALIVSGSGSATARGG